MSSQNGSYTPPRMAATFSPGIDDFYMPAPPPDVVSPAPQRITPEMPSNIQESLAHLELDGRPVERNPSTATSHPSQPQNNYNRYPQQQSPPQHQQPPQKPPPLNVAAAEYDMPNYAPFPKLRMPRPPNVPPTFEEREATLENARTAVLQSTDPEMQLEWAQDTLQYIDICNEQKKRFAIVQPTAPATPAGQKQLQTDAFNIVMFLSDQHHPKAEFLKGTWLEFGKFGFPQDKPEAFRTYKRVAANDYARAEYRMGVQFESTGESIKALQHYKAGEALGDAASCYRMGMMSMTGQFGQTQDYASAIRLIKQAADNADYLAPQGAYVYGMLLAKELTEIKVPDSYLQLDLQTGKMYLEKAAYVGFPKAQQKLGKAYEECSFGCEFDPVLSMHYNGLAAAQGEPEAEMAVSKWFLCGYEGIFRKNEELAVQYAQRAASSGLPTAQFAMGYFYEVGIHVQKNITKAMEWYEKAAANENKDAQSRLDAIAKSRTMSRADHETVTMSRMKSTYGSRRGGPAPRPMQNNNPPMPTIQDTPGPQTSPYPPQQQQPQPPQQPPHPQQPQQPQPPPGGRITPYPVDDRPISSTPYPIDDRYSVRPRPTLTPSSYPPQNQRPYSSASMRTDPYSTNNYNRPPPGPMLNPQNPYAPMPPARPSTVTGPMGPNSPPGPGGQFHGGPQSPRPGPGPGPGPGPQRPPQPQSPQAYHQQQPPQRPPEKPTTPAIDIGFSAPIDPRADQRNRPSNLHPPPVRTYPTRQSSAQHQQQQQPPRPVSAGPGPAPAPAPSLSPRPGGGKPGKAQGQGSSPYVMSGALGQSNNNTNPTPSLTPKPPAQTPASKPASSSAAGKPSASSSSSSAGQPGKPTGPQTFQEMGVPASKKDHDCIVM